MGIVVIVFKRLVIDEASGGFWPMLLLTLAAAVIGIGVYIGIMAILRSPTFGYYYRWAKERFAGRN